MTGLSGPRALNRHRNLGQPCRILSDPVLMDLNHKLGYIVPAMPEYLISS